MMKAHWLAAFCAALAFTATEAASADGLLTLEGARLKWDSREPQSTTVVSYTLLAQPYTVPQTKSILSSGNCGVMQPFSEIAATSPGLSKDVVRRQLEAALLTWEGVADLKFVEVADARLAHIVIGATSGEGKAFANLKYRGGAPAKPIMKALGKTIPDQTGKIRTQRTARSVVAIEQAYVCLNSRSQWKVGFDGNLDSYDLQYTFTHEIGHTLGLDHPGRTGSVMAYRYDEEVDQLQPSDIAAVQMLYGPKRPIR